VQKYHKIYQLHRTPHVYYCSKTGNLSIAENLGCVSVRYSEDRNVETAVTVA
jgi:ribosomal protein S11